MRLLSGCTGLWSEGGVIRNLGFKVEATTMMDKKPEAFKYCKTIHHDALAHWWWGMADLGKEDNKCALHTHSAFPCPKPMPMTKDILWISAPCQAFCSQSDSQSLSLLRATPCTMLSSTIRRISQLSEGGYLLTSL